MTLPRAAETSSPPAGADGTLAAAMFDEPEDPQGEGSAESARDPKVRARERCDEFRMHAELCAIFEGCRKFDAVVDARFDADAARDLQRLVARLDKARSPESPILPDSVVEAAKDLLRLPEATDGPTTNDYHVSRRPGEVTIARWLAGPEVESYYERLQAHFDAAINAHREEERSAHGWKQDAATLAYLDALDAAEIRMADRYLRPIIRQHGVCVLSTQTHDEIDILHLCDYLMGVPAAEVVGAASAPPDEGATERDRAWFCRIFALRGMPDGQERMFYFAYLQKAEDSFDF